jgi:hypothetical protein
MKKASISADIVASTSLNVEQRLILEEKILELLRVLRHSLGSKVFFGRLIKGDYIECVLDEPQVALRTALILKSFIKSLALSQSANPDKRINDFRNYGIRVAIGIGELSIFDKKKGIIDGEAIYLSGRAVNEMTANDKKINKTLVFRSSNENWNTQFEPTFALLDVIFLKMTRLQCEIIYHKLLGKTEDEIKKTVNKSQSTINQHAKTAGWYAIESAVKTFEKTIQ